MPPRTFLRQSFLGFVLVSLALLPARAELGKSSRPIRVACVGDSITEGDGAGPGESYPSQLQGLLGKNWEVRNFGVSGRTLLRQGDHPYVKEKAFQDAQDFLPDVVVIMLGTNDTKLQNWVHRGEFFSDYGDLVTTFANLRSRPRIFLCRPCPIPEPGNYGINEKNLRGEIPLINELAEQRHLGIIDMHAALESRPDLLPDRVHPNGAGAALMAGAVYKALTGKNPPPRPNSLFSDHAVLQQGVEIPVWGTAQNDEPVTVEFAGQKVSTVAKGGRWKVVLRAMPASAEPRNLTIRGESALVLNDILVGEVWICSGQSNMERQLGPRAGQPMIDHWQAEVKAAKYPGIRQFYVPQKFSAEPEADVRGSWEVCSPETVSQFTAVGYFFARDLYRALQIPVGILHTSWGGTPAEAWVSTGALPRVPGAMSSSRRGQDKPSVLYNAMLAPLAPFPMRGVCWYQGEANSGRGRQYRELLPALIADWRRTWTNAASPAKPGPMPAFLIVQLAPFSGPDPKNPANDPEVREAQFLTAQKTPGAALVVTTDVGDAHDIHPANKSAVGARLALAAEAIAYGRKVFWSGPVFQSATPSGARMVLRFTHTEGGLKAKDGALKGFTIAGEDRKFVPAQAVIKGDTVEVWSDLVSAPAVVRYGWEKAPDVNLCNGEGLPASPFRTDGIER